ncbi:MAG: YitT family protein [Intestinibacillus sp.]
MQKEGSSAGWARECKRMLLVIAASVVMALNIRSFVDAGGLFPGGFNGLTLLIQRIAARYAGLALPFTAVNVALNAIPAVGSFRYIGKRFTVYSCGMIVLTGVLTDLLPAIPLTNDVLLICIFGGLINGFAISLCLMAGATSGGTDFIAVALSRQRNLDAWNYIFMANVVLLLVAGYLFGWDKALYSIIFQYASTELVRKLNLRYQRVTLFIITSQTDSVYQQIRSTHHGATLFHGVGLYNGEERTMLYTVITKDQVKPILRQVRAVDPNAFINRIRTDQVSGNFYQQPNS